MRLAAVLGAFLAACGPVAPGPGPGPQPAPVGEDDIETVCNWLRVNGCEAGRDTPEGASCETVIRNAASQGIDLVGETECVTSAPSCEAADACP